MKKITMLLLSVFLLSGCQKDTSLTKQEMTDIAKENSNQTYVTINNNTPDFTEDEITDEAYIKLSELDELGRTGEAIACLGPETLADNQDRTSLEDVTPSGYENTYYEEVDNYVYNRCHQLAYCLTSLQDDEENLMTGTYSFNIEGMLPFEEETLSYIKETGNHVMYKAVPLFEDDELVARGLQLEAQSVEDDDLSFNVIIINAEDEIDIDYETGETKLEDSQEETTYVLNTNTKRFHKTDCLSVEEIKDKNKEIVNLTREEIIEEGYQPCKACNP